MKKILWFIAALSLPLLILPSPSGAMYCGTYRQFCKGCADSTSTGKFCCQACQNYLGRWGKPANCVSSSCPKWKVINCDGKLQCGGDSCTLPLREGTYKGTCRECKSVALLDGSKMPRALRTCCQCKNVKGQYQATCVEPKTSSQALQPISNCYGHLTYGTCPALLPGLYKSTCRECSHVSGRVCCQCKTPQGSYQNTCVSGSCTRSVSNCSGKLVCGKCPNILPGSYQNTCRRCYNNGTSMCCNCKNSRGVWANVCVSSRCSRPVSNCNGKLTCGTCPRSLPTGPYRTTCSQCRLSRGILCCKCKGASGWACSPIRRCRKPVSNCNGRLFCGRCVDRPFPGTYRRSCRECKRNNARMCCKCKNPRGAWTNTCVPGNCRRPVNNCYGKLQCGRCIPLFRGPYTRTCRDCYRNRYRMCCQCKSPRGRYQNTCVASSCRSHVSSCNGRLICGNCR